MSFKAMQTVFPPEQASIFGYTYGGVPNPLVPHKHPYPTRYHGPNYTVPDARSTYRERPYAESPYLGFGGTAPIFQHASGYAFVDAALGAAMGWVMAKESDRPMLVFGGGLAGYFAGTAGLLGTAAVAVATRMTPQARSSQR